MKLPFTKLVTKHKKVYLLYKKIYNEQIIASGADYSLLSFGVHARGNVTIINRGSKIAIPAQAFKELSDSLFVTEEYLIETLKATLYTEEQNALRLKKKKNVSDIRKAKKVNKESVIALHKEKLSKGEKSYIPKDIWGEYNSTILRKKSTREERIVFSQLCKKDKQTAIRQKCFNIKGKLYFPDIYLPRKKLVIEVDGGYHKTRVEEDKARDKAFASKGIGTIRIPNEAIYSNNLSPYLKLIRGYKKSKNAQTT